MLWDVDDRSESAGLQAIFMPRDRSVGAKLLHTDLDDIVLVPVHDGDVAVRRRLGAHVQPEVLLAQQVTTREEGKEGGMRDRLIETRTMDEQRPQHIHTHTPDHGGLPRGVAPQQEHLGLGLELLVRQLREAEALEEVLLRRVVWWFEKGERVVSVVGGVDPRKRG